MALVKSIPSMTRRAFFRNASSVAVLSGVASAFAPLLARAQDEFIEALIAKLSLKEKAGQLSLYADNVRTEGAQVNPSSVATPKAQMFEEIRAGRITGLFNGIGVRMARELQKVAVEQSPHGIPLIFAADVIHGLKTIFPLPVAESSSFDPELARRTARMAAREATAHAIHWTFSPMVDIARDQRWGRVGEGAGEDTYLGTLFAKARVKGFQGDSLRNEDSMLATMKHFAAYGAVEGGMEYNSVEISEIALRQTHLPPFKAGVDAGVMSFMSSFNDIAGIPSTGNPYLLTTILRKEWGFQGFVVSDFTSEEELIAHGFAADGRDAAKKSLMAGCDMSMQSGIYMKYLPDLVRTGEVPLAVLDEAVRRVLRVKKAMGLFDNPYRSMDIRREKIEVQSPEARALARESARKSIVLLKNDGNLLPLNPSTQKIALIGPHSNDPKNVNGFWVVFPDEKAPVTVDVAMRALLKDPNQLKVARGCDFEASIEGGIEAAVAAAKASDVVVLCIGEPQAMSGEAQSRTEITIPKAQMELAEALASTGKPIVVVLSHGRALALEGAVKDAPAILATWFLGSEAGNGICDVLFGAYNPSGRLSVSFPQQSGQQPYYYNHRSTGRPQVPGQTGEWKSRYREVTFEALYPFGHGLSYSPIDYGPTMLSQATLAWHESIEVSVAVTNKGQFKAHEVVQLYIRDRVASITQPVRALKGIVHLDIDAGQTQTAKFTLSRADLAFVQSSLAFEAEAGDFEIWAAPSSTSGQSAQLKLLAQS